ncbi:acyltransferase [Pedobacter sp.]|uniref:acyltransferase family protein n=1 Tax=Pedobacter sp. TaxID=1411316 RepID=UPI0031D402BB
MKENLKALDGLRGLAALYVLVHHARLALTQPYLNGLGAHPEQYEWYDKLMVYVFGLFKFGHEAVIVFFVLSGFVIHLKQADKNYSFQNFKVISYLKKRVIRIYPTLLVSFLVCVLTDLLIYRFATNDLTIFSKYTLSNFLYNVFLIPEAPIWGNNFPVWSLKHEWFFYLLYPLLLWSYQRYKPLPIFISFVLFFAYLLHLRIPFIGAAAYTLSIWLLGVILASLYKKDLTLINYIHYLIGLGFVYLLIDRENSDYYPFLDLCFGLIATGVLALIIKNKLPLVNKFLVAVSGLGAFSYSLYLLHFPILNLFKEIALRYTSNHQLPYHLWGVLLAIIITMPLIYAIYYCTERVAINYKKKSFRS